MKECPQCGRQAKIVPCPTTNCTCMPKCTQIMCHLIVTGDTEAKAVELWNNYSDPRDEITSIGSRTCPGEAKVVAATNVPGSRQ